MNRKRAMAVIVFLAMLLLGAIASTLTTGILSDRYGRKAIAAVYFALGTVFVGKIKGVR